jgi:transcriptional regulator with XRE-family HTH domain
MPEKNVRNFELLGKRIIAHRKSIKLNQNKYSNLLGISPGTLSELENEKNDPSAETLLKFIRNTDINIHWLLTGIGEMCVKTQNDIEKTKGQSHANEQGHIELINGFKDKHRAKNIIGILVDIESINPHALRDIENYLSGVKNGLKLSIQETHTDEERRHHDRRKADDPNKIPQHTDRRSGDDRRKLGT